MNCEFSFFIAVVDPDRGFVNQVTAVLQRRLNDDTPYLILGYTDSGQMLRQIDEKEPLKVPLVVIADQAARTPSVQDGLFAQVKRLGRRPKNLLYTTSGRDCAEMLELGVIDRAVLRVAGNRSERLAQAVGDLIREFEETVDFSLIHSFREAVSECKHPEESSVDDDELSPARMLIEMARGSDKGLSYLRDMHASNVKRVRETATG